MAPRTKDIIGQKFNMLTVLRELPGHRIICRCDCGNIKEFNKYQVAGGHIKSCGCLKNKIKDRTGEKFGMLTIIKELHGGKVLCRCDCGNEIELIKNAVVGGRINSCGCITRNNIKRDLTGMKIGQLTVIKPLDSSFSRFLCRCDCGNEVEVTRGHLIVGDTKSCGCRKAKAMKEIQKDTTYNETAILAIKNDRPNSNNITSGIKGVCFLSSRQEYSAYITVQKKRIHLGYYKYLEDAAKARKRAEEQYFKPIIEKFEAASAKKKEQE